MVSDSTFDHNDAGGGNNNRSSFATGVAFGGGLNYFGGEATISHSTFDHNHATGGDGNSGDGDLLAGAGVGGGIIAIFSNSITVSDSTLAHNQAVGGRGAMTASAATARVVASQICWAR